MCLVQQGYRPLLLERGKPVKQRPPVTFSKGKLYSGVKESKRHGRWVLEELVESGANSEILVLNKPLIGTFKLVGVVPQLRQRITDLGGDVRFEHHVTGVELSLDTRQLKALTLASGERIEADAAVFAVGHSSRDTFALLHGQGVAMEPKPFSIGFRMSIPNP